MGNDATKPALTKRQLSTISKNKYNPSTFTLNTRTSPATRVHPPSESLPTTSLLCNPHYHHRLPRSLGPRLTIEEVLERIAAEELSEHVLRVSEREAAAAEQEAQLVVEQVAVAVVVVAVVTVVTAVVMVVMVVVTRTAVFQTVLAVLVIHFPLFVCGPAEGDVSCCGRW